MGINVWQLLILLLIVVLVFGTKRLRNVGGDLGSAIRSFRKGLNDGDDGDDDDDNAEQPQLGGGEDIDSTADTRKTSEKAARDSHS